MAFYRTLLIASELLIMSSQECHLEMFSSFRWEQKRATWVTWGLLLGFQWVPKVCENKQSDVGLADG